ncbi:MAG: prepilin-type N-terminal cleavage/methylation domain-containing protein [Comamonadaceae bacterium]|nr:prepilin-type N-terminal cleavage/methylation domain-containing protein [Comamonadaceae bacterium]
MNPRRRQGRAAGFSLIEVLVVLVLFSIGLVGLVGMQARTTQLAADSESSARAVLLANDLAATMWGSNTVGLDAAAVSAWAGCRRRRRGPRAAERRRRGFGGQRRRDDHRHLARPARAERRGAPLRDAGPDSVTATPAPFARRARRHARTRGFSLIELLVAVAIGMALVLAVTLMLARQESARRSMGAVNDTMLGGTYASYLLDRTLRSAGSGFVQAWRAGVGSPAAGRTRRRPGAAARQRFPAPLDGLPSTVYLAPVIVHAGAGAGDSDVISVATGSSALGEAPLRVLAGSSTATGVRVNATVGVRPKDLVLVMEDGAQCMLQQVVDGFAGGAEPALDFGGTYAAQTIAGVELASMGSALTAWVAPIGNAADRRPVFQFFGVGDNAVLFSADLLRLDGSDAVVPDRRGRGRPARAVRRRHGRRRPRRPRLARPRGGAVRRRLAAERQHRGSA